MLRLYRVPLTALASFVYPEWTGLGTITHLGDIDAHRYYHVDDDVPLPVSGQAAFEPIEASTALVTTLRIVASAIVQPLLISGGEQRDRAHAAVNAWRDEQESAPIVFWHAGRRWDGGLRVRDRMRPALSAAQTAGLPEGFFWTDADNMDVPMTVTELEALAVAHEAELVAQGWRIHTRQRAMKQDIANMDEAALTAFQPGWPSGSSTTA
ncbi:DUF4376 domain-containing protein [Laribacter hongkongensis]|uniref:DUF4376 domain-containing protein n=1 Tax=Laribacter hongkongensis TaxID=168471 RepID=UPI001EFDF5B1|nr:DUF4376 domain-containing protein [Laribacter hongkongensis]MCG9074275.1 DUF4376 domain-containing protein [Laribacter hongkongensis]